MISSASHDPPGESYLILAESRFILLPYLVKQYRFHWVWTVASTGLVRTQLTARSSLTKVYVRWSATSSSAASVGLLISPPYLRWCLSASCNEMKMLNRKIKDSIRWYAFDSN